MSPGDPRRPGLSPECCFLPDLTRFGGDRRAGPELIRGPGGRDSSSRAPDLCPAAPRTVKREHVTAPPLRVVFLWHFHQPWYPTFDGAPPAPPVGAPPRAEGLLRPPRAPHRGAPRPPHGEPRARRCSTRSTSSRAAARDAFLEIARTPATEWDAAAVRVRARELLLGPPAHPRAPTRASPTSRSRVEAGETLGRVRPHGPRRALPPRVVRADSPEGPAPRPPPEARARLHGIREERASRPPGRVPRQGDPRVEARVRVGHRRGRDEPVPPPDPAAAPRLERGQARRAPTCPFPCRASPTPTTPARSSSSGSRRSRSTSASARAACGRPRARSRKARSRSSASPASRGPRRTKPCSSSRCRPASATSAKATARAPCSGRGASRASRRRTSSSATASSRTGSASRTRRGIRRTPPPTSSRGCSRSAPPRPRPSSSCP